MAVDMWTIDGKQVAVNAGTEIKGTIQVGDMVNVEAVKASDGSLTAERIQLETSDTQNGQDGQDDTNEIVGPLESMAAGVWTVGGHTITITADTEIRGAPVIGTLIKVQVKNATDGTLMAVEVDLAASNQHRDGGLSGSGSGAGSYGGSGSGGGAGGSSGGEDSVAGHPGKGGGSGK